MKREITSKKREMRKGIFREQAEKGGDTVKIKRINERRKKKKGGKKSEIEIHENPFEREMVRME